MKLANVVRGISYAACIAVAVWFYAESHKALARYAAVSEPALAAATTPAPQVPVDQQAQIERQIEQVRQAEASKAQAERIVAELQKVAIPAPKPAATPEPPHPAYSFVPQGSAQLMPLEGWVDQPNKDKPGKVHTELMLRNVRPSVKPHTPSRAPCLKMVAKPAARIERPDGHLDVPARTIPVPCGE
jgi:hypothetical protein